MDASARFGQSLIPKSLSVALTVWLLLALPACSDTPSPSPFEKFLQGRDTLAGRRNGVLLQASANVEGDDLKIHWSLDYNGPRQPLTIVAPMFDPGNGAQTSILFFRKGAGSRPYCVELTSAVRPGPFMSPKWWFVTVPNGQRATGVVPVPVAKVEDELRKRWPAQLDLAPSVFVQLNHKPRDRAAHHNLDAWTGDLHTKVIEVELKSK